MGDKERIPKRIKVVQKAKRDRRDLEVPVFSHFTSLRCRGPRPVPSCSSASASLQF